MNQTVYDNEIILLDRPAKSHITPIMSEYIINVIFICRHSDFTAYDLIWAGDNNTKAAIWFVLWVRYGVTIPLKAVA